MPVEQSRAWLKEDPDAILLEQPIDHAGLLNDASIKKGLDWMNRISKKKKLNWGHLTNSNVIQIKGKAER